MVKREDVQAVIDGILSGRIVRFISPRLHGVLDYAVAGALISVSLLLGFAASSLAAAVIPLATAAAADPSDLDQRFQTELDGLVEVKLNKLLEAKLDAQTASLLARNQTRLDGLVEAKLNKRRPDVHRRALLEAKLDAQTASLLARNHRPAAGDEILVIADSANLATRMTCSVDDSGTLS